MIETAEEFLEMVTVNKDMSLGKWDREYMTGMIPLTIAQVAKERFPKDALKALLDTIEEKLTKEMLEYTNVTLHFIIQGSAMTQYISPYEKEYHIGKTHNGVKEQVLWIFRPEYVTVGYVKEITTQEGRNHSMKERRSHEFGTCEDFCNFVALHSYEYDKTANKQSSEIHIAILIPAGLMIGEISALNYKQMRQRQRIEEARKKGKKHAKKSRRAKGVKVPKQIVQ